MSNLLDATDARPDPEHEGRFRLDMTPTWNVFYVFGGMTMAACLRVARRRVARPELALLGATATYCAPVGAGPVVFDTRVLRSSKAAAQVAVELHTDEPERTDGPALHLVAVFGRTHDTHISFTDVTYPADVPPPEQCRPAMGTRGGDQGSGANPFPRIPFHEQIEWRQAVGHPPIDSGWEPGEARYAAWTRFVDEPRRADGTIDPIALAVPGDSLGPSVWQKIGPFGPDRPPFLVLSLEITLQVFASTTSSWILQNVRCQWAGDGYGVGTTELWDEQGRLIGLALQRARLRPFTPGDQLGPK